MKMQSDGQRTVSYTPPEYPYAIITPEQSWPWRWCVQFHRSMGLTTNNYFVTKKAANRWATRVVEKNKALRLRKDQESEIIR